MISLVGSGLTSFALGVTVFEQTGSPTQFALIGFSAILPKIIVSPFAGVVADHWNRRKVMIFADAGAGLSTIIILGLFVTHRLEIWHIYLAAGLSSFFSAFQWPAYTAIIAQLIPAKHLGRANGLHQFGRAAAEILAPTLAGVLVLRIGLKGVIFIDLATFLAAIATLSSGRVPKLTASSATGPAKLRSTEFLFGWQYIVRHKDLFNLLLFQTTVNFIWGLVGALLVPMVLGFTSADQLGAIITIAGTGMLTGSILMTAWGGTRRKVTGIFVFEFISGICFMIMGGQPRFGWVALGAFGAHLTIAIVLGSNQALWQAKVSGEHQGRVFAAQQMPTCLPGHLQKTSSHPGFKQKPG